MFNCDGFYEECNHHEIHLTGQKFEDGVIYYKKRKFLARTLSCIQLFLAASEQVALLESRTFGGVKVICDY